MTGRSQVASEKRSVVPENFSDILSCFVDRRKGAIPVDHVFAGIVGRKREREISSESIQQVPEVFGPPTDIVFRIVEISHIQLQRGLRHELHQPDRTGS